MASVSETSGLKPPFCAVNDEQSMEHYEDEIARYEEKLRWADRALFAAIIDNTTRAVRSEPGGNGHTRDGSPRSNGETNTGSP